MDTQPKQSTRLVAFADIASEPPQEWLIEHVIPPTGVGMIYGASYVGKTFVAVDMALSVLNGLPDWFGNNIQQLGPIVFVLMEGEYVFPQCVKAWLAAHPGTSTDGLYVMRYHPLDLSSASSVAALAVDCVQVDPYLVFIDTQALATPGVDENSNTDMGKVMSNLKMLSRAVQCPIITVHHAGKDTAKGVRGASAQHAALDFLVHVKPGELKVEKVKGYRPSDWLNFELTPESDSAWCKAGKGKAGLRVQGISQDILDFISTHQREMTPNDVRTAFGNGTKVRNALASLVADKTVELERIVRPNAQGRLRPVTVCFAYTDDYEIEVDGEASASDEWDDTNGI
jgi:hypothetical protein